MKFKNLKVGQEVAIRRFGGGQVDEYNFDFKVARVGTVRVFVKKENGHQRVFDLKTGKEVLNHAVRNALPELSSNTEMVVNVSYARECEEHNKSIIPRKEIEADKIKEATELLCAAGFTVVKAKPRLIENKLAQVRAYLRILGESDHVTTRVSREALTATGSQINSMQIATLMLEAQGDDRELSEEDPGDDVKKTILISVKTVFSGDEDMQVFIVWEASDEEDGGEEYLAFLRISFD